ncbi:MAG: amylo-alpha-1,6-glucosidase [Planctomycetota bacterium]
MDQDQPHVPIPPYVRDLSGSSDSPLWSEWLLTNGLGGYAMGTTLGVPTRRYHGLLVASMNPPVDRVVALSSVVDRVTLGHNASLADATLTPFHFRGSDCRVIRPTIPVRFEKDVECRWRYEVPLVTGDHAVVTKTVHLFDRRNAVAISYGIEVDHGMPWAISLRPLVALRDFHALVRRDRARDRFHTRQVKGGILCLTRDAGLHLECAGAGFESGAEFWRSIEYAWEGRRGLDLIEDLYSPGAFVARGEGRLEELTLFASADTMSPEPIVPDRVARRVRLSKLTRDTIARAGEPEDGVQRLALARLAVASDDFVVQRGPASEGLSSVIAGYPWFSDWGRDTMISLPGLMLATGRHAEAFKTLAVFARHRRRGLIPNRFDDYSGPAHYNTVDASLWFLHAAAEYRLASGDHAGYEAELAPAALDIIDAYRRGTDYGIAMDPLDALISAGGPETQLTWMDAQRDGVVFTPRFGKAVEINALWHNGLVATARAIEGQDAARARELTELAARVRESFNERFVDPEGEGLFDCVVPRPDSSGAGRAWHAVREIRPNQIFAVSLPHGPLDAERAAGVVGCVRERLFTPKGLRTLSSEHEKYVGRLEGSMFNRDAAYHNGTVWPWLAGPFAEAVMRVGGFDEPSRAEARAILEPLVAELDAGYPGAIAEIFDGDETPPQRPDGCIAQAWSVAETLRVYALSFCRPGG